MEEIYGPCQNEAEAPAAVMRMTEAVLAGLILRARGQRHVPVPVPPSAVERPPSAGE